MKKEKRKISCDVCGRYMIKGKSKSKSGLKLCSCCKRIIEPKGRVFCIR